MVKVLITDKLAQEGIDLINATPGAEAVIKIGISEDELANIIRDYDGLIVRSETKVTAKVLASPGRLKGVARAGVGVDNIDVPAATRKGILVMNTPGGNTLSAAEHTMALMLAMSRNVVQACNSLKSGAWDRKKYMGNQLNNKVLGVIGLGRIGMAVAHMARGFNMKVVGYDPLAAPKNAEQLGIQVTDKRRADLPGSGFHHGARAAQPDDAEHGRRRPDRHDEADGPPDQLRQRRHHQ